jgi:hypothetical protein
MNSTSLTVKLLGIVAAGVAAEFALEFLLPGVARRLRQGWWIGALGRVAAAWLLIPAWALALAGVWWGLGTGFASGAAVLGFVAPPALATALTVWRLSRASRWRRPSRASG